MIDGFLNVSEFAFEKYKIILIPQMPTNYGFPNQ